MWTCAPPIAHFGKVFFWKLLFMSSILTRTIISQMCHMYCKNIIRRISDEELQKGWGQPRCNILFIWQSASQFTTSTNAVEFQCITFGQPLNRTGQQAGTLPKEYYTTLVDQCGLIWWNRTPFKDMERSKYQIEPANVSSSDTTAFLIIFYI